MKILYAGREWECHFVGSGSARGVKCPACGTVLLTSPALQQRNGALVAFMAHVDLSHSYPGAQYVKNHRRKSS
jgi:hypothetical protein